MRPAGEPYLIGDARLSLTRGALLGPEGYFPLTNPHDLHPIFGWMDAVDAKPARLSAWLRLGCQYLRLQVHQG